MFCVNTEAKIGTSGELRTKNALNRKNLVGTASIYCLPSCHQMARHHCFNSPKVKIKTEFEEEGVVAWRKSKQRLASLHSSKLL